MLAKIECQLPQDDDVEDCNSYLGLWKTNTLTATVRLHSLLVWYKNYYC